MKRLISAALAAVLALGMFPAAYAYTDVNENDSYYQAVERLEDFGILSGYDDGTFRPENTLTRAEFAKIVVCALNKETTAKSNSGASKFYDVPQGLWSVPYINYVSQNSLIVGYADGTFQPDKEITYAEALTVLCRILQYQEADVGYFWPNNYLDQAAALGLTEGMSYAANDPINRASAAILVDRVLFEDVNGQTDQNLLESLGYTVLEDCFIIASKNEDVSLNSDQLRTSEGVFQVENTDILSEVGKMGTLVLTSAQKMKQFTEQELASMNVVVTKVNSDNSIEYQTETGEKSTYKFDNTFVTYLDYAKSTYSAVKGSIKEDTDLTFYGDTYGNWSFAVVDSTESAVEPVLAEKDYTAQDDTIGGIPINKENLTVYRDGTAATLEDIQKNDVVYYNTKTNVMDVYTKKVTGIYYDAQPSKAYVTSVTVGGKEYTIATDAATAMLDASAGSYAIGDKVTLLLGKDDEVAFVVELSDFNEFDYGVVMSTYTRIADSGANEGASEIVAEMFMPDGGTYVYVTDRDYKDYIGDLMHLTYENGVVSMTKAGSSDAYGALDVTNRTLGGKTVLRDVKIIQRTSDDDSETVTLETLNFDTLDVTEIPESKLIASISANAFGDIGLLYVKDLSGTYECGILKSKTDQATSDTYSGTYKIYIDGAMTTYSSNINFNVVLNEPVQFKTEGGKLTELQRMTLIASSDSVEAVEGTRIMLDGTVYKMSDDVLIVDITDTSNYKTLSIDDLTALNSIHTVQIYSDKTIAKGGIVRAITVKQ